jgi:hypothetical protein
MDSDGIMEQWATLTYNRIAVVHQVSFTPSPCSAAAENAVRKCDRQRGALAARAAAARHLREIAAVERCCWARAGGRGGGLHRVQS